MTWLTNWFIRNPVAANLLMVFILFAGITSVFTVRIEGFPEDPGRQGYSGNIPAKCAHRAGGRADHAQD
jgi:hypothetical protein